MKLSSTAISSLAATLAILASLATPLSASDAIAPAGATSSPVTHMLKLADGQIAYDDSGGRGPIVICVPGIGDVRGQYRFIAPILTAAGFRLIAMDLRGLGESSTEWPDYSAASVGRDIVDLIRQLGIGKAYIVGNSMAGAAAVWAGAEIPGQIAGLVLIDPFVREIPSTTTGLLIMPTLRVALMRPWGPSFWSMYYGSLYKSAPPPDLAEYRAALVANLKQPGRIEAVKAMLLASKASCEARLPDVHAPVLVVMGTRDSDFDDPAAEANWVAAHLHGKIQMVEGAGHYPQVEYPDTVAKTMIEFMRGAQSGDQSQH
jgi:pimeloyl-ACP methyl ester carboxylesterase